MEEGHGQQETRELWKQHNGGGHVHDYTVCWWGDLEQDL